MPDPLKLRILENDALAWEIALAGPLGLGRQQAREPAAYALLAADATAPARLIVAHQDERDNVSRPHALLEPLPTDRGRVTNRSKASLAWRPGLFAFGLAQPQAAEGHFSFLHGRRMF